MKRNQQKDIAQSAMPEFQEKLIGVRRVAKTVKGGRIFSFSALLVLGDMNGRVGFGIGKAREVTSAIQKARDLATRNMFSIQIDRNTICMPINASFGATKVFLQPASEGTGVIASAPVRAVLELAGVRDVLTKCYGARNSINIVRAVTDALSKMPSIEEVARRRGVSMDSLKA